MKRKLLVLLIALAVVLTATIITIASSGRHKTPTAEPQDVTPEDAWQFDAAGGYNAALDKNIAGSKEPFKAEIPVYRESDLFGRNSWVFLCLDTSFYSKNSGNLPTHIENMLLTFPTETIRQRDDKTAYVVYDTDEGNRLFLFLLSENDYMFYRGYPIVIGEERAYKDYSDIKVGDSIEKLIAVDPVADIYKQFILVNWEMKPASVEGHKKDGTPIVSIHYLKDGLLKYEYSMPEEGKLVISDIEYSKDRVFEDCLGTSINYTVLNQDLPQ